MGEMAAGAVPALRIEVLGPLRLLVDGRPVEIRGERRTAVVAVLALAGGRVVPFDALIDSVWGEEGSPDGARQALHSLLSRLRTQLGAHADRLERHGNGYRLRLEHGELDVAEVRSLRGRRPCGRRRATGGGGGAPPRALDLWRGTPLAGLTGVDALASGRGRAGGAPARLGGGAARGRAGCRLGTGCGRALHDRSGRPPTQGGAAAASHAGRWPTAGGRPRRCGWPTSTGGGWRTRPASSRAPGSPSSRPHRGRGAAEPHPDPGPDPAA